MADQGGTNFSLQGPIVQPRSGGKPASAIIFCHGYGSNGADLISMAPPLAEVLPKTIFLSPNAHQPCPASTVGYQWFALTTLSHEERDAGTYEAAPRLDHFIDEVLTEFGLDESRLALVGFSQGVMMALHVGLRRKRQLAGIVGFSGALAAPEKLDEEIKSRPPVLLSHGDRDEVIPFPAMSEAVRALEAAGLTVTKNLSLGVAHGIGPDGFQMATAFLREVLNNRDSGYSQTRILP